MTTSTALPADPPLVAFRAGARAMLLTPAANRGVAVLVPRLAAVAAAAVVAHRTRSTPAAIGTGMVTLWVATAVAT